MQNIMDSEHTGENPKSKEELGGHCLGVTNRDDIRRSFTSTVGNE